MAGCCAGSSSGRAALAFDSVGDRLFFMNNSNDTLYEIDANDGTVIDSNVITSPVGTSPQIFDGLAYRSGLVYILDVAAETIPGQAEDQDANPLIPQIFDPPEILVFNVVTDLVVDTLNLVGTGEGPEPPGANPPGTFIDITGGLAIINPAGGWWSPSRLLLLDDSGQTVHEISPTNGASTTFYTPLSGMVGNIDAVGD